MNPANQDRRALRERLLDVIEHEICPLTERGVRTGNKVFGAAVLRKSDWSTVIAATNNETANPLWHGEVHAIKLVYELPADERPAPADCLFLATHEPCTLCLSAIAWGGYDNFYYLFSHEDSRDAFQIGHDLKILDALFGLGPGEYRRRNAYFSGHSIREMGDGSVPDQAAFQARFERLRALYSGFSDTYQGCKDPGLIPLN
ncbi:MAG: nucleoside deaminase [Burkholderiaceae bacterium]